VPIYEAQCQSCSKIFEWYSVLPNDETRPCPSCGQRSERLFSLSNPKIFGEFITRNILPGGVPVHIKSQRQLSSLCNEHHLIHNDDPKYMPKLFTPPDPAKVLGMQATPEGERGVDGGACRREDVA
jgi:putative FmdB family regulatory protein